MKNWICLTVGSLIFVSPLCLADRPDNPETRRSRIDAYCETLLIPATPDGAYDDGSSTDESNLEFGNEPDAYDSGQF